MKLIDTNVLLYAVNRQSSQHARVSEWWHAAMNSDETIGLPWIVLSGFIRISTNVRVFTRPLAVADAIKQVDKLLDHHLTAIVTEKAEHWAQLSALMAEAGTAGNLTNDAHLATLAITHDATLVSCDTDFARFKRQGLRWQNPLTR